jgi:hypothetical protein
MPPVAAAPRICPLRSGDPRQFVAETASDSEWPDEGVTAVRRQLTRGVDRIGRVPARRRVGEPDDGCLGPVEDLGEDRRSRATRRVKPRDCQRIRAAVEVYLDHQSNLDTERVKGRRQGADQHVGLTFDLADLSLSDTKIGGEFNLRQSGPEDRT